MGLSSSTSSSSSSSSTPLALKPNSYLSNNDTPPEYLPQIPPGPTLVQYLLGFSLSTIPMDDHSDTLLEEGEIFDSKVSLPAFGAAFSQEKKSVKPRQDFDISPSKAHIKSEPDLIGINCGDYRQTTSASPSKDDIETKSGLTVTLETSPTVQNHSLSTESVLTVVKHGAGSIQPEKDSKTRFEKSRTGYSVIFREDYSDAAALSQTSANNFDTTDASKAIDNSRELKEPPEISKVDFKSTDITTNGLQNETESVPLNRDKPAKTPSGEAQDLMLRLPIQTKASQCAEMAKISSSQSPVKSSQNEVPNGHSARTNKTQDTLDSILEPKMNAIPQALALGNNTKPFEDTDTSTKKDVSPPNRQVTNCPSVPPHLRPAPVAPRLFGLQTLTHPISPSDMSQGPRDRYPQRQPQYDTNAMRDRDRHELPRVQAQNMQLRKELKIERERNQKMLNSVQADSQEDIEAVLGPILAAQVHEKIALAKEKTMVSQQRINLECRNKLIEQTEAFLALGQRELYYQANAQDTSTLTDKEHEYAQQQGATNATATMRLRELDLQLGYKELNIQRVDLETRQQIYKLLVQRKIKAELRAVLEREFEARTRQIAKESYNRGCKEGREEGQKDNIKDVNEDAFAEGYATARQQQNTLVALRNGSLPYNSPDLDFLTNPDHPDNLFNMGMQVGRRETVVKKIFKTPPARPTIFEQINGASTKVNGQHILANHQSMTVNPIPNLMDDSPTPINGTATSIHNHHALANLKTNQFNMIPNFLDDDAALINGTTNHLNNPLTKPNGPSQRTKGRHVEVSIDGKVSHVIGNTVLANDNTGLTDGNRTYTNGSATPAEGEDVLANGTAINGNTSMANRQPTPESSPGST